MDPGLGWIAIAQHPALPIDPALDDALRSGSNVLECVSHLGVRHRFAGDWFAGAVMTDGDQVESLPVRQGIMHDMTFWPGPQRCRIPSQFFWHLIEGNDRSIG